MRVLMTGATGMIGKELGKQLVLDGHELIVVSRNPEAARLHLPFPCRIIPGDLENGPLQAHELDKVDAVVHLAGENIAAKRWSFSVKQKILSSRQKGSQNLLLSFELRKSALPRIFLTASAVGFYGDRQGEELSEQSASGQNFLAEVCRNWEEPFTTVQKDPKWKSVRIAQFRLGVVLGESGGALAKMLPLFRQGLGGILGDGAQWMSWVHLEDVVSAFSRALTDERYQGAFNLTAPEPVTNREFSKSLAKKLNKSLGPSVPGIALQLGLGEMASMILDSQRAMPKKLMQMNFAFKFSKLDAALENCCRLHQDGDQVLVVEQYLPAPRAEIFPFFSEAKNLEQITPSNMNFHVQKVSTEKMEAGTLIDYKLKIHGVPVHWQTLIEKWDPEAEFVDTQLKGPYAKWHHTHFFTPLGSGTLMRDEVRYRLPLGFLGRLVAGHFVENDVKKIFSFRRETVAKQWATK